MSTLFNFTTEARQDVPVQNEDTDASAFLDILDEETGYKELVANFEDITDSTDMALANLDTVGKLFSVVNDSVTISKEASDLLNIGLDAVRKNIGFPEYYASDFSFEDGDGGTGGDDETNKGSKAEKGVFKKVYDAIVEALKTAGSWIMEMYHRLTGNRGKGIIKALESLKGRVSALPTDNKPKNTDVTNKGLLNKFRSLPEFKLTNNMLDASDIVSSTVTLVSSGKNYEGFKSIANFRVGLAKAISKAVGDTNQISLHVESALNTFKNSNTGVFCYGPGYTVAVLSSSEGKVVEKNEIDSVTQDKIKVYGSKNDLESAVNETLSTYKDMMKSFQLVKAQESAHKSAIKSLEKVAKGAVGMEDVDTSEIKKTVKYYNGAVKALGLCMSSSDGLVTACISVLNASYKELKNGDK